MANKEVVYFNIEITLQYDDDTQTVATFDSKMLSKTIAQVKDCLVKNKCPAHLKQPPEFLDLVILSGQGPNDNSADDKETVLKNDVLLSQYFNCLQEGHKMALRRRRRNWQDYSTYVKRRAKENGINRDLLFVVLFVFFTAGIGWCIMDYIYL